MQEFDSPELKRKMGAVGGDWWHKCQRCAAMRTLLETSLERRLSKIVRAKLVLGLETIDTSHIDILSPMKYWPKKGNDQIDAKAIHDLARLCETKQKVLEFKRENLDGADLPADMLSDYTSFMRKIKASFFILGDQLKHKAAYGAFDVWLSSLIAKNKAVNLNHLRYNEGYRNYVLASTFFGYAHMNFHRANLQESPAIPPYPPTSPHLPRYPPISNLKGAQS